MSNTINMDFMRATNDVAVKAELLFFTIFTGVPEFIARLMQNIIPDWHRQNEKFIALRLA